MGRCFVGSEPHAMNAAACIRGSYALTLCCTAPKAESLNSDGTVREDKTCREENHTTSGRYAGDAESYTSHEAITVMTGKANARVFVPPVICEENIGDEGISEQLKRA